MIILERTFNFWRFSDMWTVFFYNDTVISVQNTTTLHPIMSCRPECRAVVTTTQLILIIAWWLRNNWHVRIHDKIKISHSTYNFWLKVITSHLLDQCAQNEWLKYIPQTLIFHSQKLLLSLWWNLRLTTHVASMQHATAETVCLHQKGRSHLFNT